MCKPKFELAEIITENKQDFIEQYQPNGWILKTLHAIELCRTANLGGHIDKCIDCGHERISYNSCRNRHCPKCQGINREKWIMLREYDLLPCSYFHVVFTLPESLNKYCMQYPSQVYGLLFQASKATMFQFGHDPKWLGAQLGMISILHTWGQNISLHPHLHIIVPGGGLTFAGNWKHARSNGKYLFCVKALSKVFRAKFMGMLTQFLHQQGKLIDQHIRKNLFLKPWVVYAKEPFGGTHQVLEYLGRYTHKIAISNHRIRNIENGKVTFSYKDYADGNKQKLMTLSSVEFLRRFCLHILPRGFRKIRHYGILASRVKPQLKITQQKMGVKQTPKPEKVDWKEIVKTKMGFDVEKCPCCSSGKMIRFISFRPHAPPIIQSSITASAY